MAIVFTCPRCDRKYSVSDAMAGRRATCRGCGQEQTVPQPQASLSRTAPPLDDFDEIGGPDADHDAGNPYARDFDDEPAAPPRSVGGKPARAAAPARKKATSRSALADLNLGSWIGGYFGINAVAFLIAFALRSTGQIDPPLISYYLAMIFWITGLGMIVFGIFGLIVVGLNNGISDAKRPLAVLAAGAVGLCLPFLINNSRGIWQPRGDTERARRAVAILREEAARLGEMNALFEQIDGVAAIQRLMPEILALDARQADLVRRARDVGRLSPAEDRFVKQTSRSELRPKLLTVLANLRRINALPQSNGALATPIRETEGKLAHLDVELGKADEGSDPGLFAGFPGVGGGPPAAPGAVGQPAGEEEFGPAQGVVVRVNGLDEEAKSTLFGQKLGDVVKAQRPGNFSIESRGTGQDGEMIFKISPARDAGELAGLMKFAHIDEVKGNKITARANLPEAELAPLREKLAAEKGRRDAEMEANRRGQFANAPAPDPGKKPEVDATTVDGALAALKSAEHFKLIEAVKRLAYGVPSGRKREVVDALKPLLHGGDIFVAKEALESLAKLKAPESVPELISLLDRRDLERDAIEALGKIGDSKAAAAIAERIASAWPVANQALIAIGPKAEPAVIPLLLNRESRVRSLACEVLEEIGGAATLAAMKKLPADPDLGVQMRARETMQKIATRIGAPPDPPQNRPTRKGR